MFRYFIGVENAMQSDIVVGRVKATDGDITSLDERYPDKVTSIPIAVTNTPFVRNLSNEKPVNFKELVACGTEYYGWFISLYDHGRVRRLIDLYNYTQEFNKLSKLDTI